MSKRNWFELAAKHGRALRCLPIVGDAIVRKLDLWALRDAETAFAVAVRYGIELSAATKLFDDYGYAGACLACEIGMRVCMHPLDVPELPYECRYRLRESGMTVEQATEALGFLGSKLK